MITLVFVYTTVDNVIERPDGVKIGACFIAGILAVSLASRLSRSFELRTTDVRLDATADLFLRDCARRTIRLVANEPDARDRAGVRRQAAARSAPTTTCPGRHDVIFVEVTVTDPSDFETAARRARAGDARGAPGADRRVVLGAQRAGRAARCTCATCTGVTPHIYFEWTEGNPATNLVRFLLFGVGEVAPVTREVLRRVEPRRDRRPHVHVS